MLKVGFGKVKITPRIGTLMAGHLHEKRATDVHDPLFAKSMIIESNDTKIAFVACDLLFIGSNTCSATRQVIAQEVGIQRENIIISATHTHSGPLCADLFGTAGEREYREFLRDQIVSSVKAAWGKMKPAKIGFASGKADDISFNRRFIMKDGTVETHPFKGNPDIVGPEGPVDTEVGVMYAIDLNGRLLGALVNFACHCTCVERESTLISADYPAYIAEAIHNKEDKNAIILFGNGACGNICQVDVSNPEKREVGVQWAKRMGYTIADEALKAISMAADVKIEVKSEMIQIPIREVTDEQLKKAKRVLVLPKDEAAPAPILSNYGTEGMMAEGIMSAEEIFNTTFWKKIEAKEIMFLSEKRKEKPYEDVEITVILINGNAIVAVPCELFVEFDLQIKQSPEYKQIFIIELSNGYVGYVPTKEAFKRSGGYETKLLRSSKLVPEAGEMIVDTAVELLSDSS